ncbi:hypothetical protein CP352_00450 [Lactobacillus sp. UMNPBX1]|uniref:hypothetical protein n=1 Tax=Lactobacillus TaxID=1578 RepID=UPI0003C4EF7B|nr:MULTISPECIES: hypothetical protein [Lactobacillus]EST03604.1 hypothetical protein Lc367_0436 [Lactobacillus crispatus EM-LC1]OXC16263.1 hypothetical protein AYP77_03555 [Lactobacillus crispatus]PEH12761.1 hypothetical protein CP352_00450 [Lactobacillus sp. UMNPBX1]
MKKRYIDDDVRGQRSEHPDKIGEFNRKMILSFTKAAADKYHQLTSSQKTFIDRELDDLKFNQNSTINKKVNAELDQAIVFERNDHEIIVTDIIAQPTRDSQEYRRAQIRMNRQNH